MSEKKKKENDVDAGAAASGARKAPEHKRRAAGASRSGANARAARQQRTDGTDTAAAKASKPRNASGQRKTGGRRTKAERSSLFDFPDITPDDVVNAAADTPETAVSSRSARDAAAVHATPPIARPKQSCALSRSVVSARSARI